MKSRLSQGPHIFFFTVWISIIVYIHPAQAEEELYFTSVGHIGDPYSFIEMNYRRDPLKRIPVSMDHGPYHDLIAATADRYNLDPGLIKAMIKVESGYNPKAVSVKGAKGLMQLMPGTAESLGVTEAFDPAENVAAGVRYLNRLKRTFRGDTILALAAYHAGEGSVLKYKGIPPYKSTQQYIYRVLFFWAHINGKRGPQISDASVTAGNNR